ncbi:HSF-type DNA-binding-domain-containing protein [Mycotypha africana]|uniref:HSF-type DNA-binding-domain-containing protein n=1 Tax=Mycotypha africana TaxID=64632 RepID=UPI002301471A|nr:HSF-type DNA-binding-domain-containing protein [Mycotypha africana]KAI8967715.1 HSF-type DNA-binding-domain-containing protein [Mycotypha africana]
MLEDPSIQNLISWSEKGDLFSVSNPTAFSKSVLPQYFKHNNWQSFVRQLNMYGFHKVNDMIHSNLTSDNQTWEFKHPHFKKGEIEELQNIKRKTTKPNYGLSGRYGSPSAAAAVHGGLAGNAPPGRFFPSAENEDEFYKPMYKHILYIEDRLHHVSRSYELLKNETSSLKGLLSKQQDLLSEFALILNDVLEEDHNKSHSNSNPTSTKKGKISVSMIHLCVCVCVWRMKDSQRLITQLFFLCFFWPRCHRNNDAQVE